MATIACPLFCSPTDVHFEPGADEAERVQALQDAADRALHAALRALDDEAVYARLRRGQGQVVPGPTALAREHAEALRQFIAGRAGA
jgi:hypothetical protein